MKYLDKDIFYLHNLLLKKKIKPSDLVLEAINECKSDKFNALEALNFNEAIKKAQELDNLEVPRDNFLFGIPFIAKDNLSTKGIETTGGSDILKGYIPSFNATVIDLLEKEGAILIAKSTLDELAMGGSGKSGHKGTQFNPYDENKKHLIGGSSSGSAISVSACYTPFALGSDTGDSVRKPASYAGLVGYKPTYGLISRFGLFPFCVSLDHVAYFTRSVIDSAYIFDVLNKYDKKDYTSVYKEREKVLPLNEDIKNKKICVIKEIINSIKDQDILNSFNKLIDKLKEKGAIIEEVSVDESLLKALFPSYIIISSAEATSNNANLDGIKFGNRKEGNTYREIMFNTRTKGFGALIKRRFILGSYSLLSENQEEIYLKAKRVRRAIVDTFNDLFKKYDYFIGPSSPTISPTIDSKSDNLNDTYLIADNYLGIANFGGYPSITLPLGIKNHFPFGVSITANIFNDKKVFELAKAIEDITKLKDLSIYTLKEKEEK